MDKKPSFKTPEGREKIFRICICAVAILALSAAITYMIRGIILDTNATKRLLAEAFMAIDRGEEGESSDKQPTTSDPEDTSDVPSDDLPTDTVELVSVDLSSPKPGISNYTSYGINEEALSSHSFSFSLSTSPLVLILHSHPEECYAPDGASAVDAAFGFTSSDKSKNVFAVGEAVAEVLTAAGIPTLHVSDDSGNVQEIVTKYRALYPSIHFVLDLHRDGVYTTDNRIVRSDGKSGGSPAAQLMLAVGTGQGNAAWQDNLAAAWQISELISASQNKIMRKILLRPESLQQEYAPLSLSLYVGTTGNTLSEAVTSARLFAKYFAIFLLQSDTLPPSLS